MALACEAAFFLRCYMERPGNRIASFDPYEEFSHQMRSLAKQAAKAVLAFRARFSSLDSVAAYLRLTAKYNSGWQVFHAAVASGLSGDVAMAQRLFSSLASEAIHYDWQAALRVEADRLASVLEDSVAYRLAILERIAESRALKQAAEKVTACPQGGGQVRDFWPVEAAFGRVRVCLGSFSPCFHGAGHTSALGARSLGRRTRL